MRVMAIDYGDARTGVAISDASGLLAGYTAVLHSRRPEQVVEELARLAEEHAVQELVLGHPKNMDASRGDRAQRSEALAELLRARTGLPVALWDERLTTVAAHRILTENGRHGKRRKQTVDAVAATLILEGYLDYQRAQRAQKGAQRV